MRVFLGLTASSLAFSSLNLNGLNAERLIRLAAGFSRSVATRILPLELALLLLFHGGE